MPSWPPSLPQKLNIEQFAEVPLDNTVSIDVESGEPMTRLRFTGDIEQIDGGITIDFDQRETLMNFWKYDLKRGALRFDWDHPITGEAVEMLFRQAPQISALGGLVLQAQLNLWILP